MPAGGHRLRLRIVPGRFAVCRLSGSAEIPPWAHVGGFVSITRARDELSIVCEEASVPMGTQCERGFAPLASRARSRPSWSG